MPWGARSGRARRDPQARLGGGDRRRRSGRIPQTLVIEVSDKRVPDKDIVCSVYVGFV